MSSSDPVVVASEHDVICARGLAAKNHAGNKRLRQLVQINLRAYSLTNSRQDKSKIVTDILEYIKGKGGDFVKLVDGKYQSVGDHLAREKIGQMFRDNLSDQYKSSTRAKRKRWRAEKQQQHSSLGGGTTTKTKEELNAIVYASQDVTQRTQQVAQTLVASRMDPNNVGAYLDQSNSDILKVLKTELSGAKPKHVSNETAADSSSSSNNHVYSKTAAKVNNKGAQQQQEEKEKQELESKVFSNKDITQKTQNLQKLTSNLKKKKKKHEQQEQDDDQEEEEESGERDSYFASLFDKNNADILKSIKKMIPSRR